MNLELNYSPEVYKGFSGKKIEQMSKLLAEDMTPLSTAGLMKARLEYGKILPDWMNSCCTSDAIAKHPEGEIKIVYDADFLRNVNEKSRLSTGPICGGYLILENEEYEKLEGEKFSLDSCTEYMGESSNKSKAKNNPIWRALARDQHLLNEYVDFIFSIQKKRSNEAFFYDDGMGICCDINWMFETEENLKHSKAAHWVIRSVGDSGSSGASDSSYNFTSTLIGVSKNPQQIVRAYTQKDLEQAQSELDELEDLINPDKLSDIKTLIDKL